MILNLALSALLNLAILAVIPFLIYYTYQKRRNSLNIPATARLAGLQVGAPRYVLYGAAAAAVAVVFLVLRPPPLEPFVREGSSGRAFFGLGLGPTSVLMALIYGVVQTGFSEELLFRGLIAGILSRRWRSFWAANVLQALIFLVPHLVLFFVMPEMWWVLAIVFVGALYGGWLRIRSGSIIGPWILHAAVNVTVALGIATRSAGE